MKMIIEQKDGKTNILLFANPNEEKKARDGANITTSRSNAQHNDWCIGWRNCCLARRRWQPHRASRSPRRASGEHDAVQSGNTAVAAKEATVKAIARGLCRLEGRLVAEREPRKTFRVMLRPPGRDLDLDNSWCQRTLCADGTVSESITLATGHDGREVTVEEVEEWIATFPIRGGGRPHTHEAITAALNHDAPGVSDRRCQVPHLARPFARLAGSSVMSTVHFEVQTQTLKSPTARKTVAKIDTGFEPFNAVLWPNSARLPSKDELEFK